jgi:hypothetical protein
MRTISNNSFNIGSSSSGVVVEVEGQDMAIRSEQLPQTSGRARNPTDKDEHFSW